MDKEDWKETELSSLNFFFHRAQERVKRTYTLNPQAAIDIEEEEERFYTTISALHGEVQIKENLNRFGAVRIGFGSSRAVYDCPFNSLKPAEKHNVIKVEHDGTYHCSLHSRPNIKEYMLWNDIVKDISYSKFFAPCLYLSKNGRILIMRKAQDTLFSLTNGGETAMAEPVIVPSAVGDLSYENLGRMPDGRIAAIDYGIYSISDFAHRGFETRHYRYD